MPDELEPEGTEEETGEVQEEKPPKKPESSALTKEEILGLVKEAVGQTVTASIRALQAERSAGGSQPDPEIEDVPDADIDAAIAAGTGSAAALRKAIKAEGERVRRQLLKDRIDPLQATGSRALGRLALRAAAPASPFRPPAFRTER